MARTKKIVQVASESDSEPSTSHTQSEGEPTSNHEKGSRKMTDAGALFKAKWLFYNDNKNNKDIVNDWIEKRKASGLTYQKPKVVNKQVVMVPDINFLDIKDATDLLWDKLNANEQKKYIAKAWSLHKEKFSKSTK